MCFIILIKNTFLKNSTTENEVFNYIIDILQIVFTQYVHFKFINKYILTTVV